MKVTQLYIVRHLLAVICSLIGVALLAIGANAALDLHTSEAAKVVSTKERASAIQLALIIGNGHYPDAAEPLHQPISDASDLGMQCAATGSMSIWWRTPPRQIWFARSNG
jgi:hypothetical protein